MNTPKRTPFASSPAADDLGQLLAWPADRSLAAIRRREAQLAADEVRVEYRGRVKVYATPEALAADLAERPTVRSAQREARALSWGWLLVCGLCALAVIGGAV